MNNDTTTKNIVQLANSAKNQDDRNNKHSEKPKNWCFKMPNALYSNRCSSFKKQIRLINNDI